MNCCELMAGKLRHTITVQREQTASDGIGGQALQWVNLFDARADVRPLSGREMVQAMQLQASAAYRIYIRYRSDLTAKDRILLRGLPLQVRAVVNVGMADRWLEISCDDGVAT